MKKEKFEELYKLDIKKDVEKDYKGLSYLSWASSYKLAMEQDPDMKYEILEDTDGLPFFTRGTVNLVKTKVTMFGETKSMILCIMDNKHNSVESPTSRQVNDNIMRCLTKNIAMFGIGLPLYVGEDLSLLKQQPTPVQQQAPVKQQQPKPFNKEKAIKIIYELVGDNTDLLDEQMSLLGIKALNNESEEKLKQLYKNIKGKVQK